jgi:hypothetical protein
MPTFAILRNEPDVRSFRQGETIFKEGDPADCMFAVVEGAVEIEDSLRLIELTPRFALQIMQVITERLRRTSRS